MQREAGYILIFVAAVCVFALLMVLIPDSELIVSASVRILAAGVAVAVARRFREWRILFLAFMFLLMASRQILTHLIWIGAIENTPLLQTVSEIPGYAVTILTLISIVYLGLMLAGKVKVIKAQDEVISTLEGLLPICAQCKKIRDDDGNWTQIESYISTRSPTQFSHGLCDECTESMYGDEDWYAKRDQPTR